jgi:hypothetical protein
MVDWEMAGHTGHSSQLFPVTTGKNAQFLATVARSGLIRVAWESIFEHRLRAPRKRLVLKSHKVATIKRACLSQN